ncbi:MAG: sulfotransferase [Zhongshania sp.]|uniref:sulfotransferase n=1 Tax=Zhongshania sp. TaxID=1971902 RepID=UPI00260A0386|nr:sulfotransferase [Zhongshania sp.]MDF1694059.1 sulfotransferase [Zhongshania sp.]
MKYPVDPCFPRADEDVNYAGELAKIPVRPIFIMGLHRSGTTFLYDCMAKSFPVAHLTLYHLMYFDRLLLNHHHNTEGRDKDRLNRCFKAMGITDRNIDGTTINADAVEEYGFLLRKKSGTFKLSEQNTALFSQLCRKLIAVEPGSQAVLLKNPWDTGNAQSILARFPEARFVYIRREPIAVLNSMLNALLAYIEGPQKYLEMLLDTGHGRRGYRAGYCAWQILRGCRAGLGRKLTSLAARSLLAKDLAKQVAIYRSEIASMPSSHAIELDYAELIADPSAAMQKLQPLLNIDLCDTPNAMTVRQRHNLNPVLENYQAQLSAMLDAAAHS